MLLSTKRGGYCLSRVLGITLLLGGCGDGSTSANDFLDIRVEIPEPDDAFIDLVSPEVIIEAEAEQMFCLYLQHEGPAVAIQELDSRQGEGGHHVALIRSTKDLPVGTLEDCTNAESIEDMVPLAIPIPLPDGHGIRLVTGQRYVMQFHYINFREIPVLVRDVARLRKIPIDEVESWVSTFTTNIGEFTIVPGDSSGVEWDCVLDQQLEIILVGGHMHEYGSSFLLQAGTGDSMRTLYTIPHWQAGYRDFPPIVPLFEAPQRLEAGDVLRTRCAWRDDLDRTLEFPEEMCAAFGYIRSTDPYFCAAGD